MGRGESLITILATFRKGSKMMLKATLVFIQIIVLFSAGFAFSKEPSRVISVEDMKVLRISPHDESAIIRTPDGKMQTIRVGDSIGDVGRVTEIVKDRIVIEGAADTFIIRMEDGKQLMQRVSKIPPAQPMPHGGR
jgi:hypothetical protein